MKAIPPTSKMRIGSFKQTVWILVAGILGASTCSARELKTNTHCIRANGKPLCPGGKYVFDSQFITITAGFPDNSRLLKVFVPKWEETFNIEARLKPNPDDNSIGALLPNFLTGLVDTKMERLVFGEDSCLYGMVGINPQLIGCANQLYVHKLVPVKNPWNELNYHPNGDVPDYSDPQHHHGGEYMDYRGASGPEHDPEGTLPAWKNKWFPWDPLNGFHQDSQYGNPTPGYPESAPAVFDTMGPPIKYPPDRIPPMKPFPAPGVDIQDMPNVNTIPIFQDPKKRCKKGPGVTCPKGQEKTTSELDQGAEVAMADDDSGDAWTANVAGADGSVFQTDNFVATNDNTGAGTDDTIANSSDNIIMPDTGVPAGTENNAAALGSDTTFAALADSAPSNLPFSAGKVRRSPRDFHIARVEVS